MSIQVQAQTLKIMRGNGRLSPDLARKGNWFAWEADRKSKRLRLIPKVTFQHLLGKEAQHQYLKAWQTGKRATSKLIALRSVAKALELELEKLDGKVYDVSVKSNGMLEVQF